MQGNFSSIWKSIHKGVNATASAPWVGCLYASERSGDTKMLTARLKSLCFRSYIRSSWTPRPSDSSKLRFWHYLWYPTMRSGNTQEQKGKYMYMGGLEPSCLLSTWVCLTELQMDKIPRKRQGSGVWPSHLTTSATAT